MRVKVTAFKAKDDSIHMKEEDQVKRDIEILTAEIDVMYTGIAEHLAEEAPFSDDWRAKAISGTDEFKIMLESLFSDHVLKAREIFRLQAKRDVFARKLDKLTAADRDPDPREDDDEQEDDDDDIRESRERMSKSAPVSKAKPKRKS